MISELRRPLLGPIEGMACPCGNPRPVETCCAVSGPLVAKHARIRSPGGLTGVVLHECYAAELNDCGEGISREHPISKSVLRVVFGNTFMAQGEQRSPDSMAAHVLCARHNNALSNLDKAAEKFTTALGKGIQLMPGSGQGPAVETLSLFSGLDLEKWLLKMLCGFYLAFGKAKVNRWTVPREWLEMLFRDRPLPPNCGVFYENAPGVPKRLGAEMMIDPVLAAGRLAGIDFTLTDTTA